MEAREVPGVPAEYDAGINRGLGVPSAFYHFAFEAGTEAGLAQKRDELIANGVKVRAILDNNWPKSIYFKDPDGIQLQNCSLPHHSHATTAPIHTRSKTPTTSPHSP